jgi:hypothetical protein
MCSGPGNRAALAVVLAGLLIAPAASTQTRADSRKADVLFKEGKAQLDRGEVDAACASLAQSQRLESAVGTLGLLAFCHERQGKVASAWREYLRAADLAHETRQNEREQVARELAAKLEPDLPRINIRVRSPAPQFAVKRNDEQVPASEWDKPMALDPGSYQVEASAPGRKTWSVRLELPPGGHVLQVTVPQLELETVAEPPASASAVPEVAAAEASSDEPQAPAPPPAPSPSKGASWTAGILLTSLGVVGIGVGGYFGLRAISKNNDSMAYCSKANECLAQGGSLRDEAKNSATISTIAVGAGIAAAGIGVVLMLTSAGESPHSPTATGFWIRPGVGPGSAGVQLGTRF